MDPDLVNSLLGSLCSPCIIDACVSTDPSDPLLTDNEIALLTQASAPISSSAKPIKPAFQALRLGSWIRNIDQVQRLKTTCSHSNRKACNFHPHSDHEMIVAYYHCSSSKCVRDANDKCDFEYQTRHCQLNNKVSIYKVHSFIVFCCALAFDSTCKYW